MSLTRSQVPLDLPQNLQWPAVRTCQIAPDLMSASSLYSSDNITLIPSMLPPPTSIQSMSGYMDPDSQSIPTFDHDRFIEQNPFDNGRGYNQVPHLDATPAWSLAPQSTDSPEAIGAQLLDDQKHFASDSTYQQDTSLTDTALKWTPEVERLIQTVCQAAASSNLKPPTTPELNSSDSDSSADRDSLHLAEDEEREMSSAPSSTTEQDFVPTAAACSPSQLPEATTSVGSAQFSLDDEDEQDTNMLKVGGRWVCQICPSDHRKLFRRKADLRRHMRTRHLQVGKPKVKCSSCGEAFSRPDAVERHLRDTCGKGNKRGPKPRGRQGRRGRGGDRA